jgi:hypothetical protein
MLLTYVDESFCKECYYVAGLLVPEHEAISLTKALDDVIAKLAADFDELPHTAELHGHDIFQGKNDWEGMKPMLRARIRAYDLALQAIGEHEVKIMIRGVKTKALVERYGDRAYHPHAVTLTHLLERVDRYAEANDQYALIIADEPGQQDQQPEYRADLDHYRIAGTWGYRRRKIARIVDTLHFAPSHASRLVQAADLIAFLYHRIVTTRRDADDRAVRANNKLWSRVDHRVEHSFCWSP